MIHFYRVFLVLICFVSPTLTKGQRLVDIINQAERAVLSVKCMSASGATINEGSGCVVSSDGIALVSASTLFSGDSILIETRSNRKFGVLSVLQVHPLANLALVKLNIGRTRDLPYLLPSKTIFGEGQEVVVFGHERDVEDGVEFGRIVSLKNFVFFNRLGTISVKATSKSIGAPVVNSRGEMAGILCALETAKPALVLDSKLVNDTNWINIGMDYDQLKSNVRRSLFSPDLNDGIQRMLVGEYELSARSLSGYIRINPTYANVYTLRSYARYMYKNTYGSREDLVQSKKLYPQGFLPYYFEAQYCFAENKKEEALLNYSICLEKKPNFAYALVEHGRLLYSLKKNLEGAYADFLNATLSDTTYGAGYYEKARFVLQHFEDKRSATKDLDNAIRLDPNLPGIFTIRGTTLIEGQNYLAAIADFDKALERDKTDMYALFNRGVAEYNLGMKDKACKDWQTAANLGHFKAVRYISRYCGNSGR
ncbi:MAG: tetratricopeptide repeat-containing serine protease family protein [Breznakibacter sp.]